MRKDVRKQDRATPHSKAEPDSALFSLVDIFKLLDDALFSSAAFERILVIELAGISQFQRRTGSVEQFNAERLLKSFEVLAERWLGHIKLLRGFGQVTCLCDCDKVVEFLYVHARLPFQK